LRASNGKGLRVRLSGAGMEMLRLNVSMAQPSTQWQNLKANWKHGVSLSDRTGGNISMLQALPGLPAYRQRTLAQLEDLIARAEGELSRRQATGGKTADKLRLAADRLALLRRSRQFLLSGEFLPEPNQRH
jgi:hypothetical protein